MYGRCSRVGITSSRRGPVVTTHLRTAPVACDIPVVLSPRARQVDVLDLQTGSTVKFGRDITGRMPRMLTNANGPLAYLLSTPSSSL